MSEQADIPELTLDEHRARARASVDEAVRTVRLDRFSTSAGKVVEVAVLHALPPEQQRSVVIDLLALAVGMSPDGTLPPGTEGLMIQSAVVGVYETFANRAIPYTRHDAEILLELAVTAVRRARRNGMEWMALDLVGQPISAIERTVRAGGVGDLAISISEAAEHVGRLEHYDGTKAERFRSRLVALLQTEGAPLDPETFDDADSWGAAWRGRIGDIPAPLRPLVAHLPLGGGSVGPPLKWRVGTKARLSIPGASDLLRTMLADVESARLREVPREWSFLYSDPAKMPSPLLRNRNVLLVRGAIWAATLGDAPWVPERLAEIGVVFGTSGRSNNVARDERIANTCAAALATLDDPAAFAALGMLKARVTNRNVSKQIAKALEVAAARRGISKSELVELAIQTMGLDANGRREERIADEVALLAVGGEGEASLTWRGPDNAQRASPPKSFAQAHATDLRRLKTDLKELQKALALERGRIEDLFVEDRDWELETWRQRYIRHPISGAFGRRLIWRLLDDAAPPAPSRSSTVMPASDGTLHAADGSPIDVGDDARLQLWHPIDASDEEIEAWRTALLDQKVRQPFKQAFREVYQLAPPEARDAVESTRFAAHYLLYSQARALMLARRWGTNFLGPFDGGDIGIAKRDFPSHGLRAQFRHDAIWPAGPAFGDVTHCTTREVRFVRLADGEAVPLGEVPPLVFSEAMRDVDLFVTVSTVGADRNWQAGGARATAGDEPFDAYWSLYSDAPLQAVARTRRDTIERMLPGLAIADRCELDDRWLRVRGDLRTYRIHLGSGNVVMEPDDTYLRIVPATGGPARRVFLPFEDDPMLSLILAKAFLVANDTAIRDRSIADQIRDRPSG